MQLVGKVLLKEGERMNTIKEQRKEDARHEKQQK
jgi:hypothetical protein